MSHLDDCSRQQKVTQATCLAVLTLLSALIIQPLQAADTSHAEIPAVKPASEPMGDLKQGESKAAVCVACHGNQGNSTISSFPKLSGQSEKYLYKQLKDMKLPQDNPHARIVPEMTAIVSSMDDTTMKDLATYFAAQTTTLEGVDPELKALGEKIYRSGNKETGVPACIACHGATGQGVPEAGFPALSGQHAAYTEAQLKAFRAAGREDLNAPKYRTNDGETMMMRKAVKGLSDKEIQAVSNYVSGLY